MKKMLINLMAISILLLFTACASEISTEENILQVGIIQITEHPSLDEIRISIEKELSNNISVEIDYQNAQNDMSNLTSIAQKFVGDEKDLIIAIATSSAQATMAVTEDIPIVFAAVNDPKAAGVIAKNVTGTSDAIPVDQIFELIIDINPEIKNIGFIYNKGESNSDAIMKTANKIAKEKGINVLESTITNSSELAQATQSLTGKVDAIFTPTDNTVAEAMPVLSDIGIENKIPIYVGADSLVKDGGLATIGVNYTNLGIETAKIAIEILNGKSPEEIPYKTMENFDIVINKTTAEQIEIEISEEIMNKAIIVE